MLTKIGAYKPEDDYTSIYIWQDRVKWEEDDVDEEPEAESWAEQSTLKRQASSTEHIMARDPFIKYSNMCEA